jgi:PPM family protein phosphatase
MRRLAGVVREAAVTWQSHTLTSAGRRSRNEDAAAVMRSAHGLHCWVLADGLGGQHGGAVAAGLAVEAVKATFHAAASADRATLERVMLAAHAALRERQQADANLETMRTTLVTLIGDARRVCWAHVGDSRLYFFRQGQLAHRTLDHSVAQALVAAGRIRAHEIRTHPDRSQLLRALGKDGDLEHDCGGPLEVRPGDAFLLCSDGVWDVMSDLEIEADLAKSDDVRTWLELVQDRILSRMRPDHDNYTMIGAFATR